MPARFADPPAADRNKAWHQDSFVSTDRENELSYLQERDRVYVDRYGVAGLEDAGAARC
jgi:hypothetical protein